MPVREFSVRELKAIIDADPDLEVEYEGAYADTIFEHEGRHWRIRTKANTDGETELTQAMGFADQFPDSRFTAEEVVARSVTVVKYVPVE